MRRSGIGAAWALLFLPGAALAQRTGVVSGSVSDTAGAPIYGAVVRVVGTTLQAFTNQAGAYRLSQVPPGENAVRVRAIGFRGAVVTAVVLPGDSTQLVFRLARAPIPIEPIVVSAAKRSQLLEEAITSVTEVSREQLDRRAVTEVEEALDRAPGVHLLNGHLNIRGSSGYAQGLGARVLLLVDGVPANQGDRGGINWDVLPVDAIDRIEIVKGAGSALYGSAAMGGVVNLITREPPTGLHGRARVTFGVYGNPPHDVWRFRDETGTQSGFDGTVSYGGERGRGELRAGGRHSDGYRENDRSDHWQAVARGDWAPSPNQRLDAHLSWASDQYQVPFPWCARDRCDDRGQEFQPFMVDTAILGFHTRSDKGLLAVAFRNTPSARFAWRMRGSVFHTRFIDFQRPRDDESSADRVGGELQAELHPSPSRVVTLGGELGVAYVTSNIFGDHSQSEYAAYAENEARWGNARVTIGARLDAIGVDGGAFEAVPSPRVGVVVPTGAGVVRASVGRGFRAPALAERFVSTVFQGFQVIPNPDLEPETGWSVELGDVLQLGGAWQGYADVAVFWNEARDLIEPAFVSGGTQIQFRNITHARLIGLDAAVSLQPPLLRGEGRSLTTSLAYTYLYSRDVDQERPLGFRPKHVLTLSADYARGRWSAGADYRYVSRIERVEIYPTDPRVSASVLDVRAGAHFGEIDARLKVENALNYIYALVPRVLAPPRTVSLTVVYSY